MDPLIVGRRSRWIRVPGRGWTNLKIFRENIRIWAWIIWVWVKWMVGILMGSLADWTKATLKRSSSISSTSSTSSTSSGTSSISSNRVRSIITTANRISTSKTSILKTTTDSRIITNRTTINKTTILTTCNRARTSPTIKIPTIPTPNTPRPITPSGRRSNPSSYPRTGATWQPPSPPARTQISTKESFPRWTKSFSANNRNSCATTRPLYVARSTS